MIEDYLNKVIQGDCLEIMKQMPDKCVDLVLTDPPYGMDYKSNWGTTHEKIHNDDNLDWLSVFALELSRTVEKDGHVYVFCNMTCLEQFKQEFSKYFNLKNILVWDKQSFGAGDTTGGGYAPQYELVLFFSNGEKKLNSERIGEVIRVPRTFNELHPTQKPIELIKLLVSYSSIEGDVVLDPFLGSGTTAVACKQLKRNFIGIELSQKYCDIANERLKQDLLF